MQADLLLKNGLVFTPKGIIEADIAVNEEKIVKIAKEPNTPKSEKTIDCRGKIILPGLIDPHVHFRDPGETEKEDFYTGSCAAAAGGITLVADMPNNQPPTSTVNAFKSKVDEARSKAVVDFCLYAGCGSKNISEMVGLAGEGAIAFKTWMYLSSPYSSLLSVRDQEELIQIFTNASRLDMPIAVHAEDAEIIEKATKLLKASSRKDPLAHHESRPASAELKAVRRCLEAAKKTGVTLYLLHLTTKDAVEEVKAAKSLGIKVFAETCPHYLLLTEDYILQLGAYAKINPPLRGKDDQEALWRALAEGFIDCVGSDHAPHLKSEKELGQSDIWCAPSGAPNIEVSLPLMLTKVNDGVMTLSRLVELMSTNIAKVFNLYPMRGIVCEGAIGSFTIIDLKVEYKIRADKLYTKARECMLFDGWRVKGRATHTIIRGAVAMEEGVIAGSRGLGRFTPRRLSR
ncbi:MAG: dihydroorotase family protein [Nitrososphaerales archaeon]